MQSMARIQEESQPIHEKPLVRVFQRENQDWNPTTPSKMLDACRTAIIRKNGFRKNKKDRLPAKSWEPRKAHPAVEAALQNLQIIKEGGPRLKLRNLKFERLINLQQDDELSEETLWTYKNHILGKSIYSKILTKQLAHLISELDISESMSSGSGYIKKIFHDLETMGKSVDRTRSLGSNLSTLKQGAKTRLDQLKAESKQDLTEELEKQQARLAALRATKQKKLEKLLDKQKLANTLADENRSLRADIRERQSSKAAQRVLPTHIEPEQPSKSGYSVFSLTDLDSKNLLDSKLYKND